MREAAGRIDRLKVVLHHRRVEIANLKVERGHPLVMTAAERMQRMRAKRRASLMADDSLQALARYLPELQNLKVQSLGQGAPMSAVVSACRLSVLT